jgi:hypothetical protein
MKQERPLYHPVLEGTSSFGMQLATRGAPPHDVTLPSDGLPVLDLRAVALVLNSLILGGID